MNDAVDAWVRADPTTCPAPGCERGDSCEEHLPPPASAGPCLDSTRLTDAVAVVAEGRRLASSGVQYLLPGLVPNYGMLGMLVAYAKVGKTTFGQQLGAAVAMGRPFLDRVTVRRRVLHIAAEDPPEYTAFVARHLDVEREAMTFFREPIQLTSAVLDAIRGTVRAGRYGFVLISSWQAVVRGLIRDENDNAGACAVVEGVKAAARASGVPWLIDAHSGKGEDQADEADPSKAMRGASAAAGSADYTLWLRYANGTFGTQRRLSAKGRFVDCAPLTLEFDPQTSTYTVLGGAKDVGRETTWRLICETGALDTTPRSATALARRVWNLAPGEKLNGYQARQIREALMHRPEVGVVDEVIRGQKTKCYRLLATTAPSTM